MNDVGAVTQPEATPDLSTIRQKGGSSASQPQMTRGNRNRGKQSRKYGVGGLLYTLSFKTASML